MNWHARMKNIACMFLVLLLALPQYVNVSAEETVETEEIDMQEVLQEETSETEVSEEEEIPEVSEVETEEEEPVINEETEPETEEEISISLKESYIELHEGESFIFEVTISGTEEETQIVWSTDNTEVIAFNEDGSITALKEGVANIKASILDGALSADAIVKVLANEPATVMFEQSSYEVFAGETINIPYTLEKGEYQDIVWSVEDESILAIDSSTDSQIVVNALQSGVVKVSAEIDGHKDSFAVVVLEKEEEKYTLTRALGAKGYKTITGTYTVNYNQSSARDLAVKLNTYRIDTAQISGLTYDFTIEKYAMQRAAEIVMSFSHTRPNGDAWHTVFDKTKYGVESETNLNENILCTSDGSMSTSLQVLNKVLADSTQRTRSLRTKNRSFGIAHVTYNGGDYWVMLFSDSAAKDKSQTAAYDGSKDVKVGIFTDKEPKYVSSKSVVKVNVGKSTSLPSITGTLSVLLGGKQKSIAITGYSVTWSLDTAGKKYATINNGKVNSNYEPNNSEAANLIATIKMNGGSTNLQVPLKVIQPVTGVEVLPKSAGVDAGKTYQMTAVVSPSNATDKTVTWKTSNSSIATVNAKGLVTGKKGGTCTITAVTNDGGFKATCHVTVIVQAKAIAFEIGELTMTPGMADKLVPVFTPADTTDKRVTFSSSDGSKVKVSNDGTVEALAVTGNNPVIIKMETAVPGEDGKKLSAELPVTVKEKDKAAKPSAFYLYDSTYEVPVYDYEEIEIVETLIKGDQIKLHTDTKDAQIYYTLDGSTPNTSSKRYTDMIIYPGGDLTIKAIAVRAPQLNNSDVATFKFAETTEDVWEIDEEDLEKIKGDDGLYHIPPGLWAAGVSEETSYTGDKITFPNLRVYYRNHLLTVKDDYKITYKNNVNVCPEGLVACEVTYKDDGSYVPAGGTKVAHIVISGQGNFKGNTYIPFKITPLAISEENGFSYQSEIYESLGTKTLSPIPVILWNGKKLKNKTDYVVAYSKDPQGTMILDGGIKESDLDEGKSSGEFYAIISGVKNFETAEERFAVPIHVKKNGEYLSKAKIKIDNLEYNGETIKPEDLNLTVTVGKETLEKGKDYVIEKVTPEPIKEIGSYEIVIKATDDSRYIGEKNAVFKITGRMISKAKVYCLGNAVTYTGNMISLKELYKYDPKRPDLNAVSLYYGDEKLIQDKDYTVVISGLNKGRGTIQFVGIGNYSGEIKKNFTINAIQVNKNDLIVYTSDMSFSKTGARPDVYVILKTTADDPRGYEISEGVYGIILIENEDYTLRFFNNKKIYTDDSFSTKNPPSVSVVMKGNYKGTIANNYFLILEEDITYMTMEAADIVYAASKKGTQYYVKPVLYDYEGKKLTLNKDYELTYYYAQDARVNGSTTYNRAYGTPLRATDVPEPGTVIGVKATGIGSYYGTISTEYKVFDKSYNLSSARVKIEYNNGKNQYFEYSGRQIVPAAQNLIVTVGKNTLVYGVDYEISSIENNIKAGKATMVLHGLGNYAGTKKVNFNIGKQTLILDIGNILRRIFGL